MPNFEYLYGPQMSADAAALIVAHISTYRRKYDQERIARTTVEKHCERCGVSFLAGGDYSQHTRKWRKPLGARFCSKSCSSLSSATLRYKPKARLAAMEHPTTQDIAWAAGIYEGEGSVSGGSSGWSLTINVAQKDPWLLARLARLFGGSIALRTASTSHLGGPCHRWTLSGARARAFALTIFTGLSPRRRAQIRKVIAADRSWGVA